VNFIEPILRQARLQPSTPALIEGERTMTYAELADLVLRAAGYLAELGIKQGDIVGLCLKDDCKHLVVLLAIARLGAIAIEFDWRSRPTERMRVVNEFMPKLVISAPGIDIGGSCPNIALDDDWNRTLAKAQHAVDLQLDWHTPAALLGSSGTTGIPKFTMATHLHLFLQTAAYLEMLPATRRHRYLQTFPLYFSSGRKLCLAFLMRGDTVILYPSLFSAGEFVEAVGQFDVTTGLIAPSLVRQFLQMSGHQGPLFPYIEFLISVGAPLFPEEKNEALRQLTPKFYEFYGATAIGPISLLRPPDMAERPTSVGRPHALIDFEVVDEDERPIGPNASGRLRCRGPALTSPIVGSGLSSTEDFREGWYYPGELALIDPLGFLYLKGRTSEIIYRGGAKIFPAEVEAALQAHDAVVESAVLAIRSSGNENEQVLVAYVTCSRGVTAGELIAHCRTHLTAFKIPRQINIVPALPKNSSGKIDKIAIRLLSESQ
jgi:acyl-coenzyme A synthetase/AMP-(fatty) acid ligase